MKRSSLILLAICLALPSGLYAQARSNFKYRTDFALTLPFPNLGGDYSGWHLGLLLPTKKEKLVQRISGDIFNSFVLPGVFFPTDSFGLRRDSGQVFQASLAYGLEHRTILADIVEVNLGGELGLEHTWSNLTRFTWPEGNINQDPEISQDVLRYPSVILSPYIGATIWFGPNLGFHVQGWLRGRLYFLDDAGVRTFNWDQRPEVRMGLNLRFGNNS